MAQELVILLGKKIRELRKLNELTQAELAERCNLSDNFIALLERGKNFPSIFTIKKLSEVFNIPISELFEFDQEVEKNASLKTIEREKSIRKLLKAKSDKDVRLIAEIAELIWKNRR